MNNICVGKILSAQGIKGHVRILSFTEDAYDIFKYSNLKDVSGEVIEINFVSRYRDNIFVAGIKGVTDRDLASSLGGMNLYIERKDLPELKEGEFYYTDLQGFKVEYKDGKSLGRVVSVNNFGGGDVLDVETVSGVVSFIFEDNNILRIESCSSRIIVKDNVLLV